MGRTRIGEADPIWRILRHQGRSLIWLAERIGYSEVMVRHVKYGIAPASPEFRAKCAAALDLPEDVLFCLVGSCDHTQGEDGEMTSNEQGGLNENAKSA